MGEELYDEEGAEEVRERSMQRKEKEERVCKEEHRPKEAGTFAYRLVWPRDDDVVQ